MWVCSATPSVEASLGTAPGQVASLSLVGGGARSPLWAQLLASTLGVALQTHVGGDLGAALGAARLAWLAVGGDLAEVCPAPPVQQRFEPDAAQAAELAPRYARFRALYPALRGEFGGG